MTFKVDPAAIRPEAVGSAAHVLKSGGVVLYPTETFYAIGAVASNERAVEKVYELKGRDFSKPLPLIASDLAAARAAASEWPEEAGTLARVFWPGALTIVVPAAPFLPSVLHAGTGRIAVRVSSHPVASMLAAAAGGLIVSTSANRAGEPPPSDPSEIDGEFLCLFDVFLDSGNLPGGLPSTIVDVTVHPAALVRAGWIAWDEIRRALDAGVSS